ncbi:MAG: hypothetical protein ACK5L6_13910 [Anaerorhabdus sp.]|uniref:hypothetical protein n=1 Tax=Anaerorhabdus sp. TaxID=1872524 RepID=UPI003A8639C1
MGNFIRSGTPTLKIKTKFDLSKFKVLITLKQSNQILNYDNNKVQREIVEGITYLRVSMTQEETLMFSPNTPIKVQFKAYDNTTLNIVVIPSEIVNISIGDILNEEIINHEE